MSRLKCQFHIGGVFVLILLKNINVSYGPSSGISDVGQSVCKSKCSILNGRLHSAPFRARKFTVQDQTSIVACENLARSAGSQVVSN